MPPKKSLFALKGGEGGYWLIGLMLAALLWAAPAFAQTSIPISLPEGRYVAIPPAGWDGKTPLPLLLYLHGYGDSPEKLLADPTLIQAMGGVLAILPAGEGGGWSFQGSPHSGRDDLKFLHHVVADARARWPVDPHRIIASGFSIGASMVWDLACHAADGFSAFLPFSGTFWVPYPDHCESGPVYLRQTHGLDDHTFPMDGRPIGLLWRQGSTTKAFGILKKLDACPAEPARRAMEGTLECETWTGCDSGKQIQLCLHTGDHYVNPAWLTEGLTWALALP